MKSKIICFTLIIALAFSLIVQSTRAFAADIETINFSVKYGQTDARKMGDKLNLLRTANGKGTLVYDYTLEKVAMQRAAEVVVRFDAEGENHYRPDGNTYKQTLADFGFDISGRGPLYGENILSGTDDTMELDNAFDQFCADAKNKNIMLGDFVAFGVAHIKMEDKTDIWVQVFSDEGNGGSFTSPLDGTAVASVRINPSIVQDITVEYSSGSQTVAAGATVSVPSYIPKITVIGSELKDPLTLSPLVFNSNDGYVFAANGTMTGLQEGNGNISVTLLGRTFSYNITVTPGNGNVVINPTQAATSAPEPTQSVTNAPSPTDIVVTWMPKPTDTVVTWTPTPTETVVTWTPTPTEKVTTTPVVTQIVTSTPTQTVTVIPSPTQKVTVTSTPVPTQKVVTTTPVPTQTATATPVPTQGASQGLKVGDTFTEGNLRYKITGTTTVAVIALASGNATSITIPASVKHEGISFSVTKIASSAFENKTKLKTVKIGKNVKNIETKAFKGCTSLTKITIPKKATKIGKSAFYGCSKLKTITFSGTAKSIGKDAFTNISSKAVIKVPSAYYKTVKKLLEKAGTVCTIKKS